MRIGGSLGKSLEVKDFEEIPDELDFIEFPLGEMENPPGEIDVEAINKILEEKDLDVTVHLPFRQPIVTTVKEFNQAEIDYLTRIVEKAVEFDAEKVVLHPNIRYGEETDMTEDLKKQLSHLDRACDERDIELCVENMPDPVPTFINNFELAEMLEELNISMCFDTGHGFSSMGKEDMELFLKEFGHNISHLHLQDTREGKDLHLPIGSSEIDFEGVSDALGEFEGTACMEIFTESRDYILLSKRKVEEQFGQ
ncbi:MAG: sugar phosphate isomerase/epimerase family protein [Candidatus Nanohaloarchaea archaeon]